MVKFKNVRVECIERAKGDPKNWEGTDRYLSIRAYTGHGDRVMMGPEIPVTSDLSTKEIERIVALFFAIVCGVPQS